jgi:hypothetical protein
MIAFGSARKCFEIEVLAGAKSKLRISPVLVILAHYDPQYPFARSEEQALDTAK